MIYHKIPSIKPAIILQIPFSLPSPPSYFYHFTPDFLLNLSRLFPVSTQRFGITSYIPHALFVNRKRFLSSLQTSLSCPYHWVHWFSKPFYFFWLFQTTPSTFTRCSSKRWSDAPYNVSLEIFKFTKLHRSPFLWMHKASLSCQPSYSDWPYKHAYLLISYILKELFLIAISCTKYICNSFCPFSYLPSHKLP